MLFLNNHQRSDFFHRTAPYYDTLLHLLTFGGYGRFLRQAIRILAPQRGEKILDLCSGTGRVASWISGEVGEEGEVVGMDITESMIDLARKRYGVLPNVTFLKHDVTRPWDDQGHFDKIFMSFALHELPGKHRAGVLERSYSALRHGGRMVVADFHPQPSGMAKIFSLIFFKMFERRNLDFFSFPQNEALREAGFRKVKILKVLGGIFQITLAHKLKIIS